MGSGTQFRPKKNCVVCVQWGEGMLERERKVISFPKGIDFPWCKLGDFALSRRGGGGFFFPRLKMALEEGFSFPKVKTLYFQSDKGTSLFRQQANSVKGRYLGCVACIIVQSANVSANLVVKIHCGDMQRTNVRFPKVEYIPKQSVGGFEFWSLHGARERRGVCLIHLEPLLFCICGQLLTRW